MTNIVYVRVFEGKDEQWYYEAIAANREILMTSEGFTRHADALRAAENSCPNARLIEGKGDA